MIEKPDTLAMSIGRRLEAIRLDAEMEKQAFSASFGLDNSTYSKIIQGKIVLRVPYAIMVTQVYDVTMDFIYKGSFRNMDRDLAIRLNALLMS